MTKFTKHLKPSTPTVGDISAHAMKLNNTFYEFTISPPLPTRLKIEFCLGTTEKESFINNYNACYNSYILPLKKYVVYLRMLPEISKVGRLHFHGIVAFKDYTSWLAFHAPRMCQFTLYDFRPEYWLQYYTKDSKMMEPFFKSIGIKYEILYS